MDFVRPEDRTQYEEFERKSRLEYAKKSGIRLGARGSVFMELGFEDAEGKGSVFVETAVLRVQKVRVGVLNKG